MSIKLMALVWERDMEPTRKLLLLKLADYANDDGSNVFPSKKTLAKKTGISERTVQRILAEFRDQGVLEVDVKANFHRPNQYHLNTYLLRGDTVTPPPCKGRHQRQ